MARHFEDEARAIAQLLTAEGWDAGAFGDGVRVHLYRGDVGVGGLLFYTDDGAWVAKTEDVDSSYLAGDRPFGRRGLDATVVWACATVRDVARAVGAKPAGATWCPTCNGYGSSLKETDDRCSSCGGTGIARPG
jgi:hypothetical protein